MIRIVNPGARVNTPISISCWSSSWSTPQSLVSQGFPLRSSFCSSDRVLLDLLAWIQGRWTTAGLSRKTGNLLKLSAWPTCLTFSTVINENIDNRMFHKTDGSKRIRSVQFVLPLKRNILQMIFFNLCHLWSIRLFSQDILTFWLWETSGWVNLEEPRVNKISANAEAKWENFP